MVTLVLTHIDQFLSLFDGGKRSLADGVRLTDKRHDRAVCRRSGINVEQLDAVNTLDLVGDLPDNGHIAAFAKIGDTFDQLFHN